MNIQEANQYLTPNYARFPITLTQGVGSRVQDDTGQSYLDFVAGIAVNTLGHAHPAMVKTIHEQATTMLHCSNLYYNPQQNKLAKKLVELSTLDKVFFCNSGAEANETAIKLARKYFHDQGVNKFSIITATQSFHGRTMQTIAATGQDKVKVGFTPLPQGFKHVPLNDIAALENAIDDSTAAIMLEPLQGEGGVHLANIEYLEAVRTLCDNKGILLIFDEIQTGIGRCGTMFAFEKVGIKPDILTLAKGLGGGVPIGAMLASEKVGVSLSAGSHGTTFGGNPMSCAVALTVLSVMEKEDILNNVQARSTQFQIGLQKLVDTYTVFEEVRGDGLLLGIKASIDVAPIVNQCMKNGLLILMAGPQVLRFLPALNITEEEIEEGLSLLSQSIEGLNL
ncbi:MAG: aspartate aminotransferase family protein [Ghiorsea sp.]|nr:aspartate aminotransferase family protein [Ghiorsea sp.]